VIKENFQLLIVWIHTAQHILICFLNIYYFRKCRFPAPELTFVAIRLRKYLLFDGHMFYNGTGCILLNALAEKRRDNYFISL
jgi:hypothetical protein